MSYTNETTHYGIPLPLGTDKTTPMDYNTSMEAVDTAVFGAVGDAATAVSDAADAKSAAQTATNDVARLTAALAETNATVTTQGTAIQNLGNKVDDVDSDLSDAICSVVEATATAAYNHKVGEYFWYNDTLYKTTVAISIGDTIVPNTNCETTNAATELIELFTNLSLTASHADLPSSWSSADDGQMSLMKVAGLVIVGFNHLTFLQIGTVSNLCIVPEGFRPRTTQHFTVCEIPTSGNRSITVEVRPDGTVNATTRGTTGEPNLSGVRGIYVL